MLLETRQCSACGKALNPKSRRYCSRACFRLSLVGVPMPHREPVPTPEQIAEATAMIRASWTEQERLERLVRIPVD